MCDTLCLRIAGGMLFAKNSDRPVNEAQVVERHAARPAAGTLRTQYLAFPDAGSMPVVGSRPTWMWGFEHGVNEHGVAAGNEKLYTVDDPHACAPALLGMDLVRLVLEQAPSADDALEILTTQLERHGQGGSGEADHDEPYFSSFLITDARNGWIVETSGRTWATRPVGSGTSISNRITLRTDWTRASADVAPGRDFDTWRTPGVPTGIADHRLAATRACVHGSARDARSIAAVLRDHGHGPWGAPGSPADSVQPPPADVFDDWSGVTVCMHVRGYQATTASLIAELREDGRQRMWACLGNPCTGVYVPFLCQTIPPELASPSEWERFARLRDRIEADADALAEIRDILAPVEADLWAEADDLWNDADDGGFTAFAARAYRPVDAALTKLGV